MEHAHEAQHAITLMTYFWHFVFGCIFAATGAYARGFCKHIHHQITLAVALILAETVLVVNLVG